MIDKLEAKRVAGCSKLVALRHKITLNETVGIAKYRFFDGVRDNLEGTVSKKGGYLEADLSKVEVSFDRIVLSGYNLAGHTSLKVKVGEDFVTPDFAEVKEENLSIIYLFKETVSPEAIRFDFFGGENVELYELEAF